MRLISISERTKYTCACCRETRSVKYMVDLYDGQGNYLDTVPMCNKCALKHKAKEDGETICSN